MQQKRAQALLELLGRNKLLNKAAVEKITRTVALSGGSVVTALLEGTGIPEKILNRALAKVYSLKPLDPSVLNRWDPRKVPLRRSVAERYNMAPLARKGKTWVVAVADPDDPALHSDLSTLLKAPVEFRVVSEIRLFWMLAQAYGTQGNIRLFSLFSRLEKLDSGERKAEHSEEQAAAKSYIMTAEGLEEVDPDGGEAADLIDEDSFNAMYADSSEHSWDTKASAPPEDVVVAETPGVPLVTAPAPPVAPVLPVDPGADPAPRGEEDIDEAVLMEVAPAPEEAPPPPKTLTREEAVAALGEADTRDKLAGVLIGFARSQYPRCLLLTVSQGENVVGWAGLGEGIEPARIEQLWLPLNGESVFKTVCETRSPFIGPISDNPIHDRFFKLFGDVRPAGAFLMPLLYEGEVSQILWLDNGDGQPADYDISDIQIVAVRVPGALQALVDKAQQELAGNG